MIKGYVIPIVVAIIGAFGAIVAALIPVIFQPNEPTPRPISISEPKPPTPKTTPDKAVREYYELINQRQYEKAWNILTPTFQRIKPDNNYTNYIKWWNSVDSVAITSIRIIEQTENKAIVDANIIYTMKNGRIWTDTSGVFTLILDANGKWLINDKTK